MENIKTLLIANRGEIAVRITRTAKALGIRTIAIYSQADSASRHVSSADEAVLLLGNNSTCYTDGDQIIKIAKEKKADAVIPGYGFLSENGDFAKAVKDAGLAWVGPTSEAIEAFGIKHVARGLAEKSGVPIVPGSKGLVEDAEDAVKIAEGLGYPVMLKATGGGGGMGLVTCKDEGEVKEGFRMVKSRGEQLFKNAGVFIERYYPKSRHIEVQVFGNGQGESIHFGERECSIQRRHQKVIEECPSPFVERRPELRRKLGDAAVRLANSIKYSSAGTVEFLVDDESADFFFLEMNTRLQVEHGITEMCYGVDLVKLMLEQGDAELGGKGGLDSGYLKSLQSDGPKGAAIEARVYAENPLRDYAPSPGLLQKVEWKELADSRIDTWVFTGSAITPHYDPLIAKLMCHASNRTDAAKRMLTLLTESRICGPPTNLNFLAAIIEDKDFLAGKTLTNFLESFSFSPFAVDVISGGAYTLVQDLPGRPSVGKGIPHSGAMDPVAFQIANILVGNAPGKEGLEVTLSGPELRFVGPAVIALTGAPMDAKLDGEDFPMWTRIVVKSGQKLKIGKTTGAGCRSYLAIYGGFPSVAEYFGSKASSPLVSIGGYQGRALAPGDLLNTVPIEPKDFHGSVSLPENLRPKYTNDWEILAMPGPHEEGYLLPEDVEMIYSTKWKVSHNASRSGIRLVGPVPKWARKDGGEGGAHPSNLIEYGYPLGALNWTGDDPCIFPVDCPNFGGFVSSTTIIRAEWYKMGQLKAGDQMQYRRVSLKDALIRRKHVVNYISNVELCVKSGGDWSRVDPLDAHYEELLTPDNQWGKAVIWEREEQGNQPKVRYRQGGDDHLIVEYGDEHFDLNHRCRVTALEDRLRAHNAPQEFQSPNIVNTVGCCTSLTIFYNGLLLDRAQLVTHLQQLEDSLGDLTQIKVPTRRFRLPISFESKLQDEANQRYMETQRPYAPYLPSNLDFVARNNAFTPERLKEIYLTGTLMAVVVGFFCGNTVSLPVDPRMRMSCPKQNPSRVFTPEGSVGWGGACMSIYPVDSPGGYQMTGRTIPCFDQYGYKAGYTSERPWLFKDFDLLTFYQVSEAQLDDYLADFRSGRYQYEWEETSFDMAEHNGLLRDTAEETSEIRAKQRQAQAKMIEAENESLERWRKEKASKTVDQGTVEHLLQDPNIIPVEAPVDANVWKIQAKAGDEIKMGGVVAILEAMKLEIEVKVPDEAFDDDDNGGKGVLVIEKLLIDQGETVKAGGKIALLRKK